MSEALARPRHLPDFKSPPLNEVVLGAQFAAPQGYQQILAGEVWGLFKDRYPQVQEHQALPPAFETFGLPTSFSPMPQLRMMTGGMHDRYWFIRPDGAELVQFQQDRLLHNWRKVGAGSNEYPRFEAMISEFKRELEELQKYMSSLSPQALSINQCEISYINHLKFDRAAGDSYSDTLRFLNFPKGRPDDFGMNFREILKAEDGAPIGRLYVEAALGYSPGGSEMILLSLSVKGAPTNTDIASSVEFLIHGREVIVQRFAELTTDQAHLKWERVN